MVLKGNLFDFAIMKTSVISDAFRARYLSDPGSENRFECRVVVFDGSDDYHHRINDPALHIDERTMLVIRGAGPVGWPGSAEVVNMQPPDALIKQGITALPTLGDGRQSGTSDSPSILNASPESAAGGKLALLRTGDVVRVDLNTGSCDVLLSDSALRARRRESPPPVPNNQTPWQEIYRVTVGQLHTGAVMEMALKYKDVGRDMPRHNH
jgi:dihydroxy-acid dehydratase